MQNMSKEQVFGYLLSAGNNMRVREIRESQPNFGMEGEVCQDLLTSRSGARDPRSRQARMSDIQIPHSCLSLNKGLVFNRGWRLHSPNNSPCDKLFPQSSSAASMATIFINRNERQNKKKGLQNRGNSVHKPKVTMDRIQQILSRYERHNGSRKQKCPQKGRQLMKSSDQIESFPVTPAKLAITEKDEERADNLSLKETISTVSSRVKHREVSINDFSMGPKLGNGKSGEVRLVRHHKTGMVFSMKIVKKSVILEENMMDQFIKEVTIQSSLDHSNIVKLYSVFDDHQHIYLLLQLCTDGNLYNMMQRVTKIREHEAAMIMKSVCGAVAELHFNQIIHRDIKPENIVMCYGLAKICDFGWSTSSKSAMRETFCGTPLYISPELLSGNFYNEKVDLWALGILGYEMMTGSIPFAIQSEKDLNKIISSQIFYPRRMKAETVDFLKCLLNRNPDGRKNLASLLSHPFLNQSSQD